MKREKPRKVFERPQKIVVAHCIFCKNDNLAIDYKNMDLMGDCITTKGKMISRRISGNCAKHQRKIAREVQRARFLALLP